MKLTRLKLIALFLAACAGLSLHAQYSTPLTISSSGVLFTFDASGNLVAQGGSGTIPSAELPQGGPTFLWYPGKAALWCGLTYTPVTDAMIGSYSAAIGSNVTASGNYSFAEGEASVASADSSVALINSTASSWCSFAAGYNADASGPANIAIGGGAVASGSYCVALGTNATSIGYNSAAIGSSSLAGGAFCFAGPTCTTGDGANESVAFGLYTFASGNECTTFGANTRCDSFLSFALGTYNIGGGTSWNSWVPTDPLFEIGNGTDSSHLSDALVVYKNGNAVLQGTLQVAPGGDIPMYGGGS